MDDNVYKVAKRGVDEEDIRWFSASSMEKLTSAQEEIRWLLDRGYKINSIIDFVGGHYQLSARQRNALQRATASSADCRGRIGKLLPFEAVRGKSLYIDGFNLIITLEVALSGGTLILGNDGVFRDLAGLRGTYKLIDKTDKALNLIGKLLMEIQPKMVKIYLDVPVSNSGRLKKRILDLSESWILPLEVELVPNPDTILVDKENVVSSDSIILDRCISWINLSRVVIENYIDEPRIIKLDMI
ncbi:MAG: DUF434 domain-containing protein [Bacillota bacterium]|nr:DUF434 domain-containing protein [Bacillota bacterium]